MDYPHLIAFYLPQFYPIPENDEWWGKGFTEWTNVAKARPLFKGHYQPHLPADLGYYDLRVPEVRQAQADMAREYGIFGFCYYHYWFEGKQLLERPFQEVLETGNPDFPFCLCWANHNWTRTWDGKANNVLLEQRYSMQDDIKHLRALLPSFCDNRYIKIDGKPIFLVIRASNLPDPKRTTDAWRTEYQKHGLGELYLCKVESMETDFGDPKEMGFDAAVEFQPEWVKFNRLQRRNSFWKLLTKLRLSPTSYRKNRVMNYNHMIESALAKPKPNYIRYPCVTPRWDNSPRKQTQAYILTNSTPNFYGDWLRNTIHNNQDAKLIFINAWNEWGEGNHLEPDQEFGRAYLEATFQAISEYSQKNNDC